MKPIEEKVRELAALALREKCASCGAEPGTPCDVKSDGAPGEYDAHVVRAIQAVDSRAPTAEPARTRPCPAGIACVVVHVHTPDGVETLHVEPVAGEAPAEFAARARVGVGHFIDLWAFNSAVAAGSGRAR